MFDHFLTNLLKVIIVLDIVGVIAYFVMGSLRQRQNSSLPASQPALSVKKRWWQRFAKRRQPAVPISKDDALVKLRRVLSSFERGLT